MISTLLPFYEAINEGNPQRCIVYCTAPNGNTIKFTEANLKMGGFQYDARSTSGEVLELGSAIAAQITFKIDATTSPHWTTFPWYGASLLVQVGVETGGTIVYGNIGTFIVDEADAKYDICTITALDNLVRFDRTIEKNEWETINVGTQTVPSLVSMACGVCGVPFGGIHANAVNTSVTLPYIEPDENTTWRNIIQYCAEFSCSVAYCDENGLLHFGFYELSPSAQTDATTIGFDKRYKSDTALEDVEITGYTVIVRDDENNVDVAFEAGDVGYVLQSENNPLFTMENASAAVANIGSKLIGLTYCPFNAQTVPYYYLQPLDTVYPYVNDGGGYAMRSIVTHISFTLNGSTTLEAVGKSKQSNSYASSGAFTRQQAVIVDAVREQMTHYVNARDQALTNLNTVMAGAMGLQKYTDSEGKWYAYYAPENQSIENAIIVYTLVNEGLAWARTDADGSAWSKAQANQWSFGITAEGNAVLNQLYVTGISVADSNSEFSTEISPKGWSLNSMGNPLMTASVATGEGVLTLQKNVVEGYIKMGKARMYGTSQGMDIVIED